MLKCVLDVDGGGDRCDGEVVVVVVMLCLFDTQTFNTLIQSTMTLYTIYEATAKKLEFSSGKSGLATLF